MTIYKIDCTGDCCIGDKVEFERAIFTGSFRNPKFSHNEIVRGTIIHESYGKQKQQHTFTLLLEDGTETRIKGRNLYRNGVKRALWDDESRRKEVLEEKHKRGAIARLEKETL